MQVTSSTGQQRCRSQFLVVLLGFISRFLMCASHWTRSVPRMCSAFHRFQHPSVHLVRHPQVQLSQRQRRLCRRGQHHPRQGRLLTLLSSIAFTCKRVAPSSCPLRAKLHREGKLEPLVSGRGLHLRRQAKWPRHSGDHLLMVGRASPSLPWDHHHLKDFLACRLHQARSGHPSQLCQRQRPRPSQAQNPSGACETNGASHAGAACALST